MLKYTDKELFQIGQNVASGWGACCESFTVNNYEQNKTQKICTTHCYVRR